jgi:hypothetical protein
MLSLFKSPTAKLNIFLLAAYSNPEVNEGAPMVDWLDNTTIFEFTAFEKSVETIISGFPVPSRSAITSFVG